MVISRSGTTTEVLQLLDQVRGRTPTTAIVGGPDTPIARRADQVVALPFADEHSVVQTRFATTALILLRAHLGEDVTAAVATPKRRLGRPVEPEWIAAEQFAFLGPGWTCGLANEAALKMREASQSWTESYPAMEYRHGPISIAGAGPGDLDVRRGARRTAARTSRRPGRVSSSTTATRWPTWCWCSGSRWSGPGPAASTRTTRGT